MPCQLITYKGLLTQYFSEKLTVDLSFRGGFFNKIFGLICYFLIPGILLTNQQHCLNIQ